MERERLLSYMTMRLSLLEAWKTLYLHYEPGDPELSDAVEVQMSEVMSLDHGESIEWDKKDLDESNDITEKRNCIKITIEKIYKLHQNHQVFLKNHKNLLIFEMNDVRKAKALSNQMMTASGSFLPKLDTEA